MRIKKTATCGLSHPAVHSYRFLFAPKLTNELNYRNLLHSMYTHIFTCIERSMLGLDWSRLECLHSTLRYSKMDQCWSDALDHRHYWGFTRFTQIIFQPCIPWWNYILARLPCSKKNTEYRQMSRMLFICTHLPFIFMTAMSLWWTVT